MNINNTVTNNINTQEDNQVSLTNYEASKYNALKHGILSRYTVTNWENKEDYQMLLNSIMKEYDPKNLIEEHLTEELASIIWRKMRLRHAEITSLQSSLSQNIKNKDFYSANTYAKDALLEESVRVKDFDIRQAILSTKEENNQKLIEVKKQLSCCIDSEKILNKTNSYDDALLALHDKDREEWIGYYVNNNDMHNLATPQSLLIYIGKIKTHYKKYIYELKNREKIKNQILGQSFLSTPELDKYLRYENHLDKKFEKTLAMLLKLKDLRETNANLT